MRTELDAVNTLLASISESAVTSLDVPLFEVGSARQVLKDVLVEVLGEGWHFNKDEGVTLTPDVDGFIYLPPSTLKIEDAVKADGSTLIERKNMLYDNVNQTFIIAEPIDVTIYTYLEINEVPLPCYTHVVTEATFRYQSQFLDGNDRRIDVTTRKVEASRVALVNFEGSDGKFNIYHNPELAGKVYNG